MFRTLRAGWSKRKGFDSQDGIALQWSAGTDSGPALSAAGCHLPPRAGPPMQNAYVYQGHIEKIPILDEILADSGVTAQDVAYIGDDLTDIVDHAPGRASALQLPMRARKSKRGELSPPRSGGQGAVREVVEMLLRAQGIGTGFSVNTRRSESMPERMALTIHARSGPGMLHEITGVIAQHGGDIVSVDILSSRRLKRAFTSRWKSLATPRTWSRMFRSLRSCITARRMRRAWARSTASGSSSSVAARRWARSRSERSQKPIATIFAANTSPWIRFRWWASSRLPKPYAPWRVCRAPVLWCLPDL